MSVNQILSGKIPFVKKLFLTVEFVVIDPVNLVVVLNNKIIMHKTVSADKSFDIEMIEADAQEDHQLEITVLSGQMKLSGFKIDNLDITKLLPGPRPIILDNSRDLKFEFQTPFYRWLLGHQDRGYL